MNAETWGEVKRVFAGALELPSGERAEYLARECAGRSDVRAEAESLLQAATASGSLPARPRGATLLEAEEVILQTALEQQYEILRPLGRGGMGSVYLARERALDRFVAIKVLRPDLAGAPAVRERFRREARIAAQLSHPGIISLHTFGDVRGIWYYVMDYVRGVSLAERLRLQGRLPWKEAHRVLTELADAVDCAHRNGIIHRDIKPGNVLLDDESGRTMLADFGIAKTTDAADSLTLTGAIIGTPVYMSPEQAQGDANVDGRTDVYSLGAVGYAMLTGREPFHEATPSETIVKKLTTDPTPVARLAPSVPEELAAVITRALAREPAKRWPSARAFRDALRRASGDSAVTVPDELRDLPTFGPYALLWGLFWAAAAVLMTRAATDRMLLLLLAALVPVGLVLHVWNIGAQGLTRMELLRIACWPPEWWGMWWPRSLRRPNDLYARLPFIARVVRGALSVLFVAIPISVMLRAYFMSGGGVVPSWLYPAQIGVVAAAGLALATGILWSFARGLSPSDTARLMVGATTPSPVWTSRGLAPLLATPYGGVRPPDPQQPTDHKRAIAELLPRLPDAASGVAAQAEALASRVVQVIETYDAEISSLSRLSAQTDVDRLRGQLAALEEATVASRASQATSAEELRQLLRRQLDVVQQMSVQSETHAERRARMFDLLRALWNQLSLIHDARVDDPEVTHALLARLRALFSEIEAELTRS